MSRDSDIASLGPGPGASPPPSPDAPRGLTLLLNADGTYEGGGAFRRGGQVRPWFGAFAEGYTGAYEIHTAVFDFTRNSTFDENRMDVYLWTDEGGCPGPVACMVLGVDPGPIAEWPEISRHLVEIGACCPGDAWWVGFWGEWPGQASHWFATFDSNAYTDGNPMVCTAPFTGWGGDLGGWIDVDDVFGSTEALGIGAYVRECDPVPVVETSWGRIKSLFQR